MTYWDTHTVTVDNLHRLGPFVDGIVGTEGKYSILNDAIAAGWTKIILASGASMNADVNLTATTSLFAFSRVQGLSGNYCINVQAADCYLDGVSVTNNNGIGIYVTAARARLVRCNVQNCSSHGIYFNASWGDHEVSMCFVYANGGDGVKIAASNPVRMSQCRIQSNTGYGVNDATNIVQITCSQINANTTGQINSTSTYIDHSVKTT